MFSKQDARRRVWLGIGIGLLANVVLVGTTFIAMRVFHVLPHVLMWLVALDTVVLALTPLAWFPLLRRMRRRTLSTHYGLDLAGAQSVDMTISLQNEPIATDKGFLLVRGGSYAFVGTKCRFAFAANSTRMRHEQSLHVVKIAVSSHEEERSFELRPNDRFFGRHKSAAEMRIAIEKASKIAPPSGWFDVLPPDGIDPDVEVTAEKLANHRKTILASYVLIGVVPLYMIINLLRGRDLLSDGVIHGFIAGATALFAAHSSVKAERARFLVHEAIRQRSLE